MNAAKYVPPPASIDLSSRVAVVTGASRGIGLACAQALHSRGATVVMVSRNRAQLQAQAEKLGERAIVIEADLAKVDGPSIVMDALDGLGLDVDILVNNAGVPLRKASSELTAADFDYVFHLNVRAVLLMSVALGKRMGARGGGSIINITSIASAVGTPGRAAYASSKGAVEALTRSLASDWGPEGVRVNAVAPGVILSDMWSEQLQRNPAIVGEIEELIPLRRWGTPDDVAGAVLYLSSDMGSYVNGHTLIVDGGVITSSSISSGSSTTTADNGT